jgi:hypothetical protein
MKQVQNQEVTQNQGEEQNLRVENTIQGEAGEALQEGELMQEQTKTSREDALLKIKSKGVTMNEGSQLVKQKSNDLAQKVQELLLNREYKGGIGEQVGEFARTQLKAQEEIQNRLTNWKGDPVWQRFFFGSKSRRRWKVYKIL